MPITFAYAAVELHSVISMPSSVTMFGCFVTVTSGRKVIDFHVEPPERGSWSCWRAGKLCASCIVVEAEKAKVRYSLVNVIGTSWSDQPPPRNPYKRKR